MLYYITGNENKIAVARKFLSKEHVDFQSVNLPLIEIQSESIEEIAKSKAEQAYALFKQPLFVNDHGWSFPALNGFPGPFMKYMNTWLTPEDFLRLMEGKENREANLIEVICYQDANEQKLFIQTHKGKVLHEASGTGLPATTVTTLSSDNISIAMKKETSPNAVDDENYTIWKDFAEWYKSKG